METIDDLFEIYLLHGIEYRNRIALNVISDIN